MISLLFSHISRHYITFEPLVTLCTCSIHRYSSYIYIYIYIYLRTVYLVYAIKSPCELIGYHENYVTQYIQVMVTLVDDPNISG